MFIPGVGCDSLARAAGVSGFLGPPVTSAWRATAAFARATSSAAPSTTAWRGPKTQRSASAASTGSCPLGVGLHGSQQKPSIFLRGFPMKKHGSCDRSFFLPSRCSWFLGVKKDGEKNIDPAPFLGALRFGFRQLLGADQGRWGGDWSVEGRHRHLPGEVVLVWLPNRDMIFRNERMSKSFDMSV